MIQSGKGQVPDIEAGRNIRVIHEPTVYLVGRQIVDTTEVDRFLADHGVRWQTDTEVAGEHLVETAGRVCFDDQTEILTDHGWKRLADLDRTEPVMTLNPDTLRVEWERPLAYQVYDYDGVLKCAEGRDVSLAVTPEHRQFGTFRYWQPRSGYGFVSTEEIGSRRFCILSAGRGWRGEYPDVVSLPEVVFSQIVSNQWKMGCGTATTKRSRVCITGRERIRALARLLCYYATEGSVRDQKGAGRGIVIYGDHVEKVTALCQALGLKWNLYTDKRNGVRRVLINGGIQWLEFFVQNAGRGSPNKRLPRWVLDLPSEDLLDIWNILVRMDGHVYENGREVLVTSSTTLAGQAQEILCKIGASSAVRPMSACTNYPMYMVSRKHGRPICLNDWVTIEEREYKGKVYCVTTSNGVVYVRRNGLVHFSGNCYMSFAKPRPGGNKAYVDHILEVGHGSVLEHAAWNFVFTGCSRSLTHELVRHRTGWSYSQLSQRYVDESIAEYIEPDVIAGNPELHALWLNAVAHAHQAYVKLVEKLTEQYKDEPDKTLRRKLARQAARSVLPNATETKIFVTANARALRHFIEMRASRYADVDIRKLAVKVLQLMQTEAPHLFNDYQLVPLPDGTFEADTPHRKV
ncbi:MAG TPA: FAD-dependent thymidylate synthase [Gemmataceae bacterium]|nr:FAD-dependent thymidylate synthase [Gemmataceae bacterium]